MTFESQRKETFYESYDTVPQWNEDEVADCRGFFTSISSLL